MALPLPTSLSPSKVSSFTDCALAFRFSAIDKVPEPPQVHTTRGTLVHAALEDLYTKPATDRTLATALTCLSDAYDHMQDDPELTGLALDAEGEQQLLDDSERLVRNAFELEDPTTINPIGIELFLTLELDGLRLRGIIDRLELDDDGELVVTDYKTGKAPKREYEQSRFGGVTFYSLLCERLFGRRPAKVQLLYLADPVAVVLTTSERANANLERKVRAIWQTIERACDNESFAPKPSRLCDWCAYQTYCPAKGGSLDRLADLAPPADLTGAVELTGAAALAAPTAPTADPASLPSVPTPVTTPVTTPGARPAPAHGRSRTAESVGAPAPS